MKTMLGPQKTIADFEKLNFRQRFLRSFWLDRDFCGVFG